MERLGTAGLDEPPRVRERPAGWFKTNRSRKGVAGARACVHASPSVARKSDAVLPTACYSRRRRAKTKLRFLAWAHVSPTTSTTSRSTCIRTCSTRGKLAAVCALRWLPPCLSSVAVCAACVMRGLRWPCAPARATSCKRRALD
jgi:hypothetical protein